MSLQAEPPTGWRTTKLKYLVRAPLAYGVLVPDKYEGADGVRLIRITDVSSGRVETSGLDYVSKELSAEYRRTVLAPGDLVVSVVGTLGETFIAPESLRGANLSRALARVQLRQDCDARFVRYWMRSKAFDQTVDLAAQGSAQKVLNLGALGDFELFVPDQGRQRVIADFLDRKTAAIDAIIEKKERLATLVGERRHAAIWTAVTKGLRSDVPLRSSGHRWLERIPAHWAVARTRQVARLESGHTPSRQHPEYWIPEECTVPWVSLADVWQLREGTTEIIRDTAEKISPIGIAHSAARLLPAGTVVVSRTASVGFSGIIAEPMATTQDFVNFVCGPKIRPLYLLYVFRAMRDEFRSLTMGSTHQTIYMPDVARFVTPVPPLSEQDAIVEQVQRTIQGIDGGTRTLTDQLGLLREYSQALITAAVTGQLDLAKEAA